MKKDYRLIVGWFFLSIGMIIEFILFIINPHQALFESFYTHPILSAISFFFCFYGFTLCARCIISIKKEWNKLDDENLKTDDKEKINNEN